MKNLPIEFSVNVTRFEEVSPMHTLSILCLSTEGAPNEFTIARD